MDKTTPITLTRADIEDLIMNAYQRGYEDRDLDIGYGSNRPNALEELDKKRPVPPAGEVWAVFDGGAQGMKDNGLLGIFSTAELAKEAIGDNWWAKRRAKLNTLYLVGGVPIDIKDL